MRNSEVERKAARRNLCALVGGDWSRTRVLTVVSAFDRRVLQDRMCFDRSGEISKSDGWPSVVEEVIVKDPASRTHVRGSG